MQITRAWVPLFRSDLDLTLLITSKPKGVMKAKLREKRQEIVCLEEMVPFFASNGSNKNERNQYRWLV